ncbi:MAG: hypothetical protein JJE12_02830 [Anaerolineales bacterium]|nr:hypothetical protein [Anaerolineales bacterium]
MSALSATALEIAWELTKSLIDQGKIPFSPPELDQEAIEALELGQLDIADHPGYQELSHFALVLETAFDEIITVVEKYEG